MQPQSCPELLKNQGLPLDPGLVSKALSRSTGGEFPNAMHLDRDCEVVARGKGHEGSTLD